jgi:non-specific serine/threonine protein kinase
MVVSMLRRPDVRLVTVIGPAGVGKTRLALQIAYELATALPITTTFVELAPLVEATLVVPSIAQALGVLEAGPGPLFDALIAHLQDRDLLLILDNFEHVLAAGPLLADLAIGCPRLKLLVTSRARLRISPESIYSLPPLTVPPDGHGLVGDLMHADAVRLFATRAEALDPAFALTETNAAAVAEICRRLDGLPLAIELAAAWVDMLPPQAMLARLDRRLPLLTEGPRDAPARHQTMRAAIAWSHDLLSPVEQALFRRLAVFAGGFSLEAAEWVAGEHQEVATPVSSPAACGEVLNITSVLEVISALCHKSLLHFVGAAPGEARYTMLQTLREFGLEQLDASGETNEIRRKQGEYLVALAKRTDPLITESYDDRGWLDLIEAEDDNLWSVLSWSLESGDIEIGLRIADAVGLYWYLRKRRLTEARAWLDRALARARRAGVSDRVLALALACASTLAHLQDDAEQAAALAEESLAIFERLGASVAIARVRYILAIAVYMQGDCNRAELLYHDALKQLRAEGDRYFVAEALLGVANVAIDHGDFQVAAAAYDESLQISRQLGSRSCAAMAQFGLGFLARGRGDPVAAQRLFQESLVVWGEIDDPASIAVCLEALAGTICGLGAPRRAARLLGAAEALREKIGYPIPQGALPAYQQTVAGIQSSLSMIQFVTSWVEGRTLSVAEAVALAGEELPLPNGQSTAERPRRRTTPCGLTTREIEVLRLLARGYTDREIADSLFISRRTASDHVGHILRKLNARSRADAAAFAVRHDLV